MIYVRNVYKRYKLIDGTGPWVLEDINLKIPAKVSVGILGKNGAGKSTLLSLIGGLDKPNAGEIERLCKVGWPMTLSSGLKGGLTGKQNARFVCRILGYSEEEIIDRIAFIRDFADIGSAFDEPVSTYSSGMKGRLQFGISLAFNFDVYISDEGTSAGDASFVEKAHKAFKRMINKSSIIMASHSESTLKDFCSAGIFLHQRQAYWFDDINEAIKTYKKTLKSD